MKLTKKKNEGDEIDLLVLFDILKANYIKISFIALFCLILGGFYCFFATPIYKADAKLQYDGVSKVSLLDSISESMPFVSNNSQVDAEIQVIKSRMILGTTVDALKLDISVKPKRYFWEAKDQLIDIEDYSVSDSLIGEQGIITYLGNDKYSFDIDDQKFTGFIGSRLRTDDFSLLINRIVAKEGQEFNLIRGQRYSAIDGLRGRLTVAEVGKNTGIIDISILGANKKQNVAILNNIVKNYVAQNVKVKKEVTDNTLLFLDEYTPKVKLRLDSYENELNNFRKKHESIDLSMEAKQALDSSLNIEQKLNELKIKELEVKQLYTTNHPVYQSLVEKRKQLLLERDKIAKSIQKLPNTQQEIVALTRDVQSEQEIYNQLVTKKQELSVLNSGITADVRVIDDAESEPLAVAPRKKLILLISFVAGLILGCGYVFVRYVFTNKIKNIDDVDGFGINVYATIPFSNYAKKLRLSGNKTPISQENPADPAVEAIRSLRTSVYFSVMNQKNNLVMFTSPTASAGKSFITSNLAILLASAGKKILLMDADLRKGTLSHIFNLKNAGGLSDYLSQKEIHSPVVYKDVVKNLDVICRGKTVMHSSELLMSERFKYFIDSVKDFYDIVIMDTTPILAITDSSVVGKYAGTSLLVVHSGHNTGKEVEMSLKYFKQNDVEISGIVLNGVEAKSNYYYYEYK